MKSIHKILLALGWILLLQNVVCRQCDQTLDWKSCPNVSKSCLNNIHSSFYINWSFFKKIAQKSAIYLGYFCEFVAKNFQKSPNLVTLFAAKFYFIPLLNFEDVDRSFSRFIKLHQKTTEVKSLDQTTGLQFGRKMLFLNLGCIAMYIFVNLKFDKIYTFQCIWTVPG